MSQIQPTGSVRLDIDGTEGLCRHDAQEHGRRLEGTPRFSSLTWAALDSSSPGWGGALRGCVATT